MKPTHLHLHFCCAKIIKIEYKNMGNGSINKVFEKSSME